MGKCSWGSLWWHFWLEGGGLATSAALFQAEPDGHREQVSGPCGLVSTLSPLHTLVPALVTGGREGWLSTSPPSCCALTMTPATALARVSPSVTHRGQTVLPGSPSARAWSCWPCRGRCPCPSGCPPGGALPGSRLACRGGLQTRAESFPVVLAVSTFTGLEGRAAHRGGSTAGSDSVLRDAQSPRDTWGQCCLCCPLSLEAPWKARWDQEDREVRAPSTSPGRPVPCSVTPVPRLQGEGLSGEASEAGPPWAAGLPAPEDLGEARP